MQNCIENGTEISSNTTKHPSLGPGCFSLFSPRSETFFFMPLRSWEFFFILLKKGLGQILLAR